MIIRTLYAIAFITVSITGYIAFQDRNLRVIQTVQIPIDAEAVRLPFADEAHPVQGELLWRGGIKVSSSHQRFGGLSGLEISPDGRSLLAVTDKGLWFKGRLSYDKDGNLLSMSQGVLSSLNGSEGQALTRKRDRDSESLAMADDGSIYVSFERHHRILRYSAPLDPDAIAIPIPTNFTTSSKNKGIEALTWLPGGCLLAIPEKVKAATENSTGENAPNSGLIEAHLWDQFSWQSLYLEPNGDFLPTGLSVTPEGDLLLLERSFSFFEGFKTSLRYFPAEEIFPGNTMQGKVLASFQAHTAIDNMEGISSRLGPNGETLIYLLSDDNLSFAQDTLLLMFEFQNQRKPAGLSTAGCSKNKTAYSAALETKAF